VSDMFMHCNFLEMVEPNFTEGDRVALQKRYYRNQALFYFGVYIGLIIVSASDLIHIVPGDFSSYFHFGSLVSSVIIFTYSQMCM